MTAEHRSTEHHTSPESSKVLAGAISHAQPRRQLAISSGLILAFLLILSALAWWGTVRGASWMNMGASEMNEGSIDSMTGSSLAGGIPFFLASWTTMMIAMMFPSVAPMVIAYRRMAVKQRKPTLATSIFVAGYIVVWTAMGVGAYLLYEGLQRITPQLGSLGNALVVGGLLAVAGAYQLSKLKTVCLTHCRGPLAFFFHFRQGLGGGFRMGAEHGVYCVGCCWGLMLILFAFGFMNLAWMGAVAALIFVEKVTKVGPAVSRIAGVGMLIAAVAIGLLGVF